MGMVVSDSTGLGSPSGHAAVDRDGNCWCGLSAGHSDAAGAQATGLVGEARRLLAGDRQQEYGDAADTHRRIAQMWNAIVPQGARFRAVDVALAMIAVKLVRASKNPQHTDSWVDIVGYAQIGADLSVNGDIR